MVTRPRTHRILEVAFRPVTETVLGLRRRDDRASLGDPVDREHRAEKVIPGIAAGGALRGRGDRVARRAQAPDASPTELGIPSAHGSYEALLADPDVDAVYIPLPNHLHARVDDRRRPGRQARPVREAAGPDLRATPSGWSRPRRRAGVLLMEAFMYRLHPSWVAVRDLVASGRIGRLTAVQSWFSYFNDDPANIRNIREVGGGALFDIGCYSVNLSRMLFGAEPTSVRPRSCATRTGVDILTSGILEFERRRRDLHLLDPRRGRPARPHLRHGRPHLDRHPVQHPARPADPDLRDRRRRAARRPGGRAARPSRRPIPTRSRPSFAAAVLDGAPAPSPPADAVANLRVIERIFEAAEARPGVTGSTV